MHAAQTGDDLVKHGLHRGHGAFIDRLEPPLSDFQRQPSSGDVALQLQLGIRQAQQIIHFRQGEGVDVATFGDHGFGRFQLVGQPHITQLQILKLLVLLGQAIHVILQLRAEIAMLFLHRGLVGFMALPQQLHFALDDLGLALVQFHGVFQRLQVASQAQQLLLERLRVGARLVKSGFQPLELLDLGFQGLKFGIALRDGLLDRLIQSAGLRGWSFCHEYQRYPLPPPALNPTRSASHATPRPLLGAGGVEAGEILGVGAVSALRGGAGVDSRGEVLAADGALTLSLSD